MVIFIFLFSQTNVSKSWKWRITENSAYSPFKWLEMDTFYFFHFVRSSFLNRLMFFRLFFSRFFFSFFWTIHFVCSSFVFFLQKFGWLKQKMPISGGWLLTCDNDNCCKHYSQIKIIIWWFLEGWSLTRKLFIFVANVSIYKQVYFS